MPDTAPQVEAVLARRREREAAATGVCVPQAELPLQQALQQGMPMQHVRLLSSSGRCPAMRALPPGTHIPVDLFSCAGARKRWFKPTAPPVSEDATCARLAAAEHARIVLCSGAFECLVGAQRDWELPLTVRAVEGGAPGRPVIFIDKPVLPARMSLRAKNEVFYKARDDARSVCVATLALGGDAMHARAACGS